MANECERRLSVLYENIHIRTLYTYLRHTFTIVLQLELQNSARKSLKKSATLVCDERWLVRPYLLLGAALNGGSIVQIFPIKSRCYFSYLTHLLLAIDVENCSKCK